MKKEKGSTLPGGVVVRVRCGVTTGGVYKETGWMRGLNVGTGPGLAAPMLSFHLKSLTKLSIPLSRTCGSSGTTGAGVGWFTSAGTELGFAALKPLFHLNSSTILSILLFRTCRCSGTIRVVVGFLTSVGTPGGCQIANRSVSTIFGVEKTDGGEC